MAEKKIKILIIDDDTFLLDMYSFKFDKDNFEVHTTRGGIHALDKLKEGLHPDIILLDIIMPQMDGFEMLEKINSEKLSEDSIKIILSNKDQQVDIDRGKRLGVAGYIVKANATPSEVIEKVMKIYKKVKAGEVSPVVA